MPEKSVYTQRLDEIENRVYQEFLKALGFRKHGRAINRIVDGDMVQIIYFEGGNTIRMDHDSFRVHFSIRVPEATERTFTPKPLKKGGYHEADANFRLNEMCKLEELKGIPSYYRYPLFEGCEEEYKDRIIKVLKEKVLPVFEAMDNREKFLKNWAQYVGMTGLIYNNKHDWFIDRAMIMGRMGCMEEAQESLQRYYEERIKKDLYPQIGKQYVESLARDLGVELRGIQNVSKIGNNTSYPSPLGGRGRGNFI